MTTAGHAAHHGTLVFERTFDAPVAAVFSALSDPVARARWSAPTDAAVLIYDEADFRVGGRDFFRRGAKSDPKHRGETRYLDIAPNRRIVSTEVIDEHDRRLAVAVNALELEPVGVGAKSTPTVQLAALDGPGVIEGSKAGYAGALDNPARELRSPSTSQGKAP